MWNNGTWIAIKIYKNSFLKNYWCCWKLCLLIWK